MSTVYEEIYDTSSGGDEPDADDEIIVVPFVKPPPTIITIPEESDNETESSKRKRSTAKSGDQNHVRQEQLVQKRSRQFEGNNNVVPASNIFLPSVSALADQLTLSSTPKTNNNSSEKRTVDYSESSSAGSSKRKRKATSTDTPATTATSENRRRKQTLENHPEPDLQSTPKTVVTNLKFPYQQHQDYVPLAQRLGLPCLDADQLLVPSPPSFLEETERAFASKCQTRQRSVSPELPEPDPSSVSAQQHDPDPAKWTPEMKRFYGEELRTPNLFRIQRRQSSDYRKWRTMEDQCRVRKRKVHTKCGNCSQWGHHTTDCPQKPKTNLCFMCGLEGHQMQHCSRAVCLNCGSKQSFFVQSCTNCVENFQTPVRCAHCGIEGHRDSICPDHWRRYHAAKLRTRRGSKTGQMKLKILMNRQSFKAKNRSSCANCGRLGHNYFQCKGTKRPNPYFVNTPEIVQKLTLEEAEKVVIRRARSESESVTPPNQEVENSVSSANEEEAQLENSDDGFPSFPLENETVVLFTESERELLLKSYQSKSKKSTMYSFFNTHSANIVKIVNHEEDNSVHVHVNGSDKLTVKEVVSGLRQLLEAAEVKEEMTDLTEDDDDSDHELTGSTGSPDFKYNFLNSQVDGESSDESDDPDSSEPCPEVWELNRVESDSEIIDDDDSDHSDAAEEEEEDDGEEENDDEIEIIGEVVRTPSSSQDSTGRDAEVNSADPVPIVEPSPTAERIEYGETALNITTNHWLKINSRPISLIIKIEQALAVHITLLHVSFNKKLLRIHGSTQLCRKLAKTFILGWINSRNGRSFPCSFVCNIISMRIKYGLTRTEDDIQNPWFEFANRRTILLNVDPEPNFLSILNIIENNVKKRVPHKFDAPGRKIELESGVNKVQEFALRIWLSTYFKCKHGNESYADQIMGELWKWENDPRFALIYLGDELLSSMLKRKKLNQKQVHQETQEPTVIDLPLLASERRVLEEENRKNSILQVLEEYFQVKVELLDKEIILHNCGMDFKYLRIQGNSRDGRQEQLAQASILGFLERKRLKGEIMMTDEEEEELESVGEDGARIQLSLDEWNYLNRHPPCFPSSYISQLKAIYGVKDKLQHVTRDEKILCLEGGRRRNQLLGIAYIFARLDKYRGSKTDGPPPTVSAATATPSTTNQPTSQEKKMKKSLKNDKGDKNNRTPTGWQYNRQLTPVHLKWVEKKGPDSFVQLISSCNQCNDDWNLSWYVRSNRKTGLITLSVKSLKKGIRKKVKLAIKEWFSRKTRQKKLDTKPTTTTNTKNNRIMKHKKKPQNNRNRRLDEGDEGRNLGNDSDEESTASGHSYNLRSGNCSGQNPSYLMYQRTKAKYLKNSNNNRKIKIENTEPNDDAATASAAAAAPPRKISKKTVEKLIKRKKEKKKSKKTENN